MKKIVKSLLLSLTMICIVTCVSQINAKAATKSKNKETAQLEVSAENGVDAATLAQYNQLAAQVAELNAQLTQLQAYRDAQVKKGFSADEIAETDASIDGLTAALETANAQYTQVLAKAQEQMSQYADVQARYQELLKTVARQEKEREQQKQTLLKSQAKNNKNANPVTGVILIGDSRFVQMHDAMGDTGAMYICENAKGYDWLMEEAIDVIDRNVSKGTRVVFNLGVNDTRNCSKYIETVNSYAVLWTARGAKVYYATVNLVWDNPYTSREQVNAFNNELKTKLVGVNIIDTNAYLTETGCKIVDGLHYDAATYAKIYSYIMNAVVD